ncbi:unnamed protein product [Allacma fusca]|uniref:Uncharacterized protein n=1 Tax=Allacma fusca TaxID=39272 RepID=A0A8J2P7S5_9HEXA|nr:unnamed protein product [Allacma fusca]
MKIDTSMGVHFIKLISLGSAALLQLAYVKGQREVVKVINGAHSIQKKVLREGYFCKNWWESVVSQIAIVSIAGVTVLFPPLFSIILILFPHHSMNLIALLPPKIRSVLIIRLIFSVHEWYIMVVSYIIMVFCIIVCWSYFVNIQEWLPTLSSSKSLSPGSSNVIRRLHFQSKLDTYNQLCILSSFFNYFMFEFGHIRTLSKRTPNIWRTQLFAETSREIPGVRGNPEEMKKVPQSLLMRIDSLAPFGVRLKSK